LPYRPGPLPAAASKLLRDLTVPTQLKVHLEIVHDTAKSLIHNLAKSFPGLVFDQEAILFGAATHDIGKLLHRDEIHTQGQKHLRDGDALLRLLGVPPHLSRFAASHGTWSSAAELEDLLVALADQIWKGRRDPDLAFLIVEHLVTLTGRSEWQVFMELDDLLADIAATSNERLEYALIAAGLVVRATRISPCDNHSST
jgi:hypothetical protein